MVRALNNLMKADARKYLENNSETDLGREKESGGGTAGLILGGGGIGGVEFSSQYLIFSLFFVQQVIFMFLKQVVFRKQHHVPENGNKSNTLILKTSVHFNVICNSY